MKEYEFKDIEVGMEVSFEYVLDEEMMYMFKNISKDTNPLHNDLEYAKENGYKEKVVYGLLTASCLSSLAGMYIPGKYSLIHNIEISFIKPVYLIDCPLIVQAKVVSIDERFKQIELKYNIYNQSKEKVCRGKMKIGVTK